MSRSPSRIRLATFLGFRTVHYQASVDVAAGAPCTATLNLIQAAQAGTSGKIPPMASTLLPIASRPPTSPPRGKPSAQPRSSSYFASAAEGDPEFATDFATMRRNARAMLADLRRKARQLDAMESAISTPQPRLDKRQAILPGKRPDRP